MFTDSMTLVTGSNIVNLTVAAGSSLPLNVAVGCLFYKTTDTVGLFCYDGVSWNQLGTAVGLTDHTNDQTIHLTSAQNDLLDSLTVTSAELNFLSGTLANVQAQINDRVSSNFAITPSTATKISYDSKGLVLSGVGLSPSDIPNLDFSKITSGLPTTYVGYGITDVAPLSHVGASGDAHAAATITNDGFMSAVDKIKLDSVSADANNFVLLPATSSVLGGIKNGNGLAITSEGVISADVLSVSGKIGNVTLTSTDVGLSSVENKSSATIRGEMTSGDVSTALGYTPENVAMKNQAGGYAGLDVSGMISTTHLPAITITDTFVVGSNAAMLTLTAQTGDVAVRTDLNKSFILKGQNPTILSDWQELLTPTDTVTSVNGQIGAVSITDITGNSGTATKLQNVRNVALVSDVVGSANFDGSANASIVTTLATTGVTAATYGSSTQIGTFVVDAKGRLTSATNVNITPAFSSITNLPTTRAGYGIVDAAALTHTHNGTDVTFTVAPTIPGATFTNNVSVTGNLSTSGLTDFDGSYNEKVSALTWSGAVAINSSIATVFTATATVSSTISFTGAPIAGKARSITLELTNGGAYVINWTGVKWPGGIAPSLTSSGVDILVFYTRDGGVTWRGTLTMKDSK